jgi:hypothetical protein
MGQNEKINKILYELMVIVQADMMRRSYDESGEQKQETLERIDELKQLIKNIRGDL